MSNVFQGMINAFAPAATSGRPFSSRSGYSPRAGSLCHKVLLCFQHQAKPMTISTVASLLEMTPERIQRAVIRMRAQGILESCGRDHDPQNVTVARVAYRAIKVDGFGSCGRGGATQAVHEFLSANGDRTVSEISKQISLSYAQVSSALQRGIGTYFSNETKVDVSMKKDVSVCLYKLKG